MKRIFATTLLSLCLTVSSVARAGVFSVENLFYAYFPVEPEYLGLFGSGDSAHHGYSFFDEPSGAVYSAVYLAKPDRIAKQAIPIYMKTYAKGNALSVNGSVHHYEARWNDGVYYTAYTIKYSLEGADVIKRAISAYKDGQFMQWSVQAFPKASRDSAYELFDRYVKHFKVQ